MTDLGWTCLVTGANRGLGFEFIRQCVAATQQSGGSAFYICCCRTPEKANELNELVRQTTNEKIQFKVLKLEVGSFESFNF